MRMKRETVALSDHSKALCVVRDPGLLDIQLATTGNTRQRYTLYLDSGHEMLTLMVGKGRTRK